MSARFSDAIISEIVKKVVAQLSSEEPRGVFSDMDAAIAAAKASQRIVAEMPMSKRAEIIARIRTSTQENAEVLAQMAVDETGMGVFKHKVAKHRLVAQKTPGTEDITTVAFSGDRGLTLVEMGPFGVIGAITPSTNPSETVICNTIGMLAGGNTVVFNPHPAAAKTSAHATHIINAASLDAGGPDNIACCMQAPTTATGGVMMSHPDIALLVATGGPGLVDAVLASGKRGIGAGAGNPPVLVDDTCDVCEAAAHIIHGATFDNNLPCIAEKAIVALDSVADELISQMTAAGCYHASPAEISQLERVALTQSGGLNRECVGRNAATILGKIGVRVPPHTACIIFEEDRAHPFIAHELMMPILGIVRVRDFQQGVEAAHWLESGNKHSAHIHSKNVDRITCYARTLDTAIIVKNAPSYAALGYGGEGFCSFTIASRTGEGLTSARTFTKSRRCVMSDNLCIR